jgi:ABC-2 type transport system permease protein
VSDHTRLPQTSTPQSSTGVIHDIGYRSYSGPREGTAAQAWTLFVTGLRHAWGLGRSGRSKVLPFLLLAMVMLPAVIMVGAVVLMEMSSLPTTYAAYSGQTSWLVSLFAAAQAPVLFSRDLRHRSIVLYLARPLPAAWFAVTRWASLTAAILGYLLAPSLLMYVGGLLSGLEFGEETPHFLKALVLQVVLAMLLAGITGVVSAWALRRGFAVVISIMFLIVASSIVSLVQSISRMEYIDTVGEVAGLFSPWALFNGLGKAWDAGTSLNARIEGAWPTLYAVWMVALIAACVLLLVRRFTKVGAR